MNIPVTLSELTKFRQRIGEEGANVIFFISVKLHDDKHVEKTVTYPTDSKLTIRINNQINKLAKADNIKQR